MSTSILRVKTIDESLKRSFDAKSEKAAIIRGNPSSSLSNEESPKDAVKFDKIIIRNYNRAIAYNRAWSSVIPADLSWEHEYDPEDIEVPLEKYEMHRDRYRRSKREMPLPEEIRHDLLRYGCNVPISEIVNVTSNNRMLQRQRIQSSSLQSQSQRRVKVEAFLKTAKRGFTQMVCNQQQQRHRQYFTHDVILNEERYHNMI
jgi:hypothetical protein